MCRLSWNLGASTSWNPLGLSRSVMGLLYRYYMVVGDQHHAPAALPPGKTRYLLYRRLGGPQGRSGQVRKISPLPGFDPRPVQPAASRYTDWATWPAATPTYWQRDLDFRQSPSCCLYAIKSVPACCLHNFVESRPVSQDHCRAITCLVVLYVVPFNKCAHLPCCYYRM